MRVPAVTDDLESESNVWKFSECEGLFSFNVCNLDAYREHSFLIPINITDFLELLSKST